MPGDLSPLRRRAGSRAAAGEAARSTAAQIATVLSTVLANYAIQDVSVEDPPLEEVIASLFALTEKQDAATRRRGASRRRTWPPTARSRLSAAKSGKLGLRLRPVWCVDRDMLARVQLWWTISAMCIAERLAYRGDFVLGTTMRFLPIVTQIFLWTAVFASARLGHDGRLHPQRHRGVLPADDDRPGVFQHAGAGQRHRPADSRRRDQEVSHPADRPHRLHRCWRGSATSWCTTAWRSCRSRSCSTCAATISPAGRRRSVGGVSRCRWCCRFCWDSSWKRRWGCADSGRSRSARCCSSTCCSTSSSRATCFRWRCCPSRGGRGSS